MKYSLYPRLICSRHGYFDKHFHGEIIMTDQTVHSQSAFQTGHIGLNVSNLNRSKQFYQQVFNFDVLAESQKEGREFAFLGDKQRIVLTLWQQSSSSFEKNQAGLHHLSFQVDTMEIVHQIEHKLCDMSVHL